MICNFNIKQKVYYLIIMIMIIKIIIIIMYVLAVECRNLYLGSFL